jgi:hypothetical protein
MKKIIVAVGSTRKPKLRAVAEALKAFASKLVPDGDFEVVGMEVESGVNSTPSASKLSCGWRAKLANRGDISWDWRAVSRFCRMTEAGECFWRAGPT